MFRAKLNVKKKEKRIDSPLVRLASIRFLRIRIIFILFFFFLKPTLEFSLWISLEFGSFFQIGANIVVVVVVVFYLFIYFNFDAQTMHLILDFEWRVCVFLFKYIILIILFMMKFFFFFLLCLGWSLSFLVIYAGTMNLSSLSVGFVISFWNPNPIGIPTKFLIISTCKYITGSCLYDHS